MKCALQMITPCLRQGVHTRRYSQKDNLLAFSQHLRQEARTKTSFKNDLSDGLHEAAQELGITNKLKRRSLMTKEGYAMKGLERNRAL